MSVDTHFTEPYTRAIYPLVFVTDTCCSSVLEVPELVYWCLDKGADAGLSSPSGPTIIEAAAGVASLDTLKLLVERAGSAPQGDAVACASYLHGSGHHPDRLEVVRFLLDQRYPIDEFFRTYSNPSGHDCAGMVFGKQTALAFYHMARERRHGTAPARTRC